MIWSAHPNLKKFGSDSELAEVHKHQIRIQQKKLRVLEVLKVIDHLLVVVCRCDQLPHTVTLTLPQLSAQVSHLLSTNFHFKLFVSEVTLSKIDLILQVAFSNRLNTSNIIEDLGSKTAWVPLDANT